MAPIQHGAPAVSPRYALKHSGSLSSLISTAQSIWKRQPLTRREQMISIPATYTSKTTSPGVIVGIVFGVVAAFVIIVVALFFAFGRKDVIVTGTSTVGSSDIQTKSSRSRYHRPRQPDVVEVHESVTSSSFSGTEGDVIEVYEEHDEPPPPRRHRRDGRYRSVEPSEYGGGSRPPRRMRW